METLAGIISLHVADLTGISFHDAVHNASEVFTIDTLFSENMDRTRPQRQWNDDGAKEEGKLLALTVELVPVVGPKVRDDRRHPACPPERKVRLHAKQRWWCVGSESPVGPGWETHHSSAILA